MISDQLRIDVEAVACLDGRDRRRGGNLDQALQEPFATRRAESADQEASEAAFRDRHGSPAHKCVGLVCPDQMAGLETLGRDPACLDHRIHVVHLGHRRIRPVCGAEDPYRVHLGDHLIEDRAVARSWTRLRDRKAADDSYYRRGRNQADDRPDLGHVAGRPESADWDGCRRDYRRH